MILKLTQKKSLFMALLMCFAVASATLTQGCASESSKTVTTESVNGAGTGTTKVIEHETVTKEENHAVVGSAFHFVGEVIALPFRLVGDLFDAIF